MWLGAVAVASIAFVAGTPAWAAPVVTTMRGHMTYVAPSLMPFGVQAGDLFEMVFEYDDEAWTPFTRTVNGGAVYTVRQFTFTADFDGWSGSLVNLIQAKTSDATAPVLLESWYRPSDVLHHDEWFVAGWNLTLVTNYNVSASDPAYGWYGYEQADMAAFLLDHVQTSPSMLSEPGTLAVAGLALAVAGVVNRRRTNRV